MEDQQSPKRRREAGQREHRGCSGQQATIFHTTMVCDKLVTLSKLQKTQCLRVNSSRMWAFPDNDVLKQVHSSRDNNNREGGSCLISCYLSPVVPSHDWSLFSHIHSCNKDPLLSPSTHVFQRAAGTSFTHLILIV